MKKLFFICIPILISISLNAQNPQFEWVKTNQGYQGSANSIHIGQDSAGNIYGIGHFSGTVDFNPSPSNAIWLTATNSGSSSYIQKLDSNGNLLWVRAVDFQNGSFWNLEIDPTGRLYIVGNFKDSVDIDPGIGIHMLYSHGGYDAYILKLSANGNFIWAKSFGGPEDDIIRDIVVDKSGNVYSHGSYEDTVDFDPGPGICVYGAPYTIYNDPLTNAFIQKLDIYGNFVWAKAFLNTEFTGGSRARSIRLDSQGNVFCRGFYSGSVDFDPGSGMYNLLEEGVYLVKLDSSGSYSWANSIYIVNGAGAINGTMALEVDKSDNIYTIGRF